MSDDFSEFSDLVSCLEKGEYLGALWEVSKLATFESQMAIAIQCCHYVADSSPINKETFGDLLSAVNLFMQDRTSVEAYETIINISGSLAYEDLTYGYTRRISVDIFKTTSELAIHNVKSQTTDSMLYNITCQTALAIFPELDLNGSCEKITMTFLDKVMPEDQLEIFKLLYT